MDIYVGLKVGTLEVKAKDEAESKRRQRQVWICYCSKCGQTKSIEGRCITESTEDCGCGKHIRAAESKRKRLLESAKAYIGTINNRGTEYLGIDEEETKKRNTIMIFCRCGGCKRIYSAPLNQIRVGKYPACSWCTRRKTDFSAYKRGEIC